MICNSPAPHLAAVKVRIEIIVDENDSIMVERAKNALITDIENAVKHNTLKDLITVEYNPYANVNDIPDYLKEEEPS